MVPGEPEWLPEDAELALAWQVEQDTACPGCGHPADEAMDPGIEHEWEAKAMRCHACAARAAKGESFASSGGESAGLFLTVSRRP